MEIEEFNQQKKEMEKCESILSVPRLEEKLTSLVSSIETVLKGQRQYERNHRNIINKPFTVLEAANEPSDNFVRRSELMIEQLSELEERNRYNLENMKEFLQKLDDVKAFVNEYIAYCEKDVQFYNTKMIEFYGILDERYTLEECGGENMEMRRMEIQKKYTSVKTEVNRKGMEYGIEYDYVDDFLIENELKQIEEWTKLKCSEIIFDTEVDDWADQKLFNSRILGKKQFVVIVEDTDGNRFGGYVNAIIDKIRGDENKQFNYDPQSFLFSLNSNGRLPGMMKFESKVSSGSKVILYNHGEGWCSLMDFGEFDLAIVAYQYPVKSRCNQGNAYDYKGIQFPFSGSNEFIVPP